MWNSIDTLLESVFAAPFCLGQVLVRQTSGGFVLSHRDDEVVGQLQTYQHSEDALMIAKHDDAGKYRPLKTAPNLRRGWQLQLATIDELRRALDYFYPGRLSVFAVWKTGHLKPTALRDTLDRQSGMYRVAGKISDPEIDELVADFCRSDTGCLRTILWERDGSGVIASTKLPKEKFDPAVDQMTASSRPGSATPATAPTAATIPLLCQEPCNLLVAQCRKVVKGESANL